MGAGCLDDQTVTEVTSGVAPPEVVEHAHRHAATCVDCKRRLLPPTSPSIAPTAPAAGDQLARLAQEEPLEYARPGSRIGRYIVLEVVGEGGMGVVYSAYDPTLDRRVALKAVSGRLDGERNWQDSLLREAQAMAQLAHPNVVTVYDAAVLGGRVYVAMEFVSGRSLRAWLHEQDRTWREIVQTFVHAGEGLWAAHAAGLVHRDFKADNLLVREDGRVSVTDFGLAQPTGTQSRTGRFIGTVGYLAPEQGMAEPLTPASDQFSFCVALYEALYRQRPFPVESASAQLLAAASGIIKEPPAGIDVPSRVRRAVFRGLAAKPAERFASMRPLLSELSRALHPRGPRRIAQAATALALTGLVGGGFAWQAHRAEARCTGGEARVARELDASARDRVEQALRAPQKPWSEALARHVLADLDGWAKRWSAAHHDACAATQLRGEQTELMMQRRMVCLDGMLREYASLARELQTASGEGVDNAAKAAQSLPNVERCADLEALAARRAPPTGEELSRLEAIATRVADGRARVRLGKARDALATLEAAVAEARTFGHPDGVMEARAALAEAQYALSDHTRAAEGYLEAGNLAHQERRDEDAALYWARAVDVWINGEQAAGVEAKRMLALASASVARLGPGHEMSRADLLTIEGEVAYFLGEYVLADEKLSEALAVRERIAHVAPIRVAENLRDVGSIAYVRNDYARAERYLTRSMELFAREYGEQHPDVASVLSTLGLVFHGSGELERAKDAYARALAMHVAAFGEENPEVATDLNSLAVVSSDLGDYAEAVRLQQRALAQREKAYGGEHPLVAMSLNNLADALLGAGEPDRARPLLDRALAIRTKALGADHPKTALVHAKLARLERETGRPADAVKRCAKFLPVLEKQIGKDHVDYAIILSGCALAQVEAGQLAPGLAQAQHADSVYRAKPASSVDVAGARFVLARALWATGQKDEARRAASETRALLQQVKPAHRVRRTAESWFTAQGL